MDNLNDCKKDMIYYIEFGLYLMRNLELFFKQSDTLIKIRLISSILKEKIEFDGKKYRTPKFKEGFQYIYYNIKELEVLEIKKGDDLQKISPFVLEAGLEPARPQWPLDFKSNVSTNSTTRAGLKQKRAKDGI